ncbi:cupin domain-containing protein [Pararhodospirillum photometricum]|nr:cupin domain-containing protein [Pararhodospirillum photometricum]
MRPWRTLMIAGGALALSASQAWAEGSVSVVERLSTRVTAAGQPLVLPTKDARLIVTDYTIAPGATLAVHKHPFSRFALVEEGTLRVERTADGHVFDYKPGDIVVEIVDEWHRGTNTGTTPVRLVVFDLVEGETKPTQVQTTP